MRSSLNTSASAGLCCAHSSLLGTISLSVSWLGQLGRGAVQMCAEIPSFALPRRLQPKGLSPT